MEKTTSDLSVMLVTSNFTRNTEFEHIAIV